MSLEEQQIEKIARALEKELCQKLGINRHIKGESKRILLSIFQNLYHWLKDPRDTEESEASQVHYSISNGIAYGMKLQGDEYEVFFNIIERYVRCIKERKLSHLSPVRRDIAEQLCTILKLPLLDNPQVTPSGKIPTPGGNWTSGKDFVEMKDSYNVDMLHPKKTGRKGEST